MPPSFKSRTDNGHVALSTLSLKSLLNSKHSKFDKASLESLNIVTGSLHATFAGRRTGTRAMKGVLALRARRRTIRSNIRRRVGLHPQVQRADTPARREELEGGELELRCRCEPILAVQWLEEGDYHLVLQRRVKDHMWSEHLCYSTMTSARLGTDETEENSLYSTELHHLCPGKITPRSSSEYIHTCSLLLRS